jgi:hypothetical protein
MPEFTSRDPLSPAFWDERFERGFTPWERGRVPDALRRFVADSERALRTLIPGGGSARELVYLLDAGWDATAIDFSPAAVMRAQAEAGKWGDHIVEADFFTYVPPAAPDLIYEQAFLCAVPRASRPAVAGRWAGLLPQGGLLAGFFFFGDQPKGPPFGISREELDRLLLPHFECVEDQAVDDSIPIFAGKERWLAWRRR